MMALTDDQLRRAAVIIRELAASEPICESGLGDVFCCFCDGSGYEPHPYGSFVHDETCIVMEARRLVAESPEMGGKRHDWLKEADR